MRMLKVRGEKTIGRNRNFKICVLAFPFASPTISLFLFDMLQILEPISGQLYAITGKVPTSIIYNKNIQVRDIGIGIHFRKSISPDWWSVLLWLCKNVIIQIKMSYELVKISKNVDALVFLGTAYYLLPLTCAKLLGKKVMILAAGLGSLSYRRAHDKGFFSMGSAISTTLIILEKLNFYLSDRILVESRSVVNFLGLDRYRQKLVTSGARYIDTNRFQIKKELKERRNLIGYIGRIEEGKGAMNFVKAIPLILEKQDNLKFFIGGHGPLSDRIKNELENNNSSQKVELKGWISHNKVADYLNELKLFILPSYSEGLPTGVLEAMACGTPVLATPVGGVPDVIKDRETGFILENNSSECIAKNVIRALEHQNLEEIMRNARKLIEEKYTYDAAVERYRKILEGA